MMISKVFPGVPSCPSLKKFSYDSGKELSYRSCGEGLKIIFLHGLLGSSKAWAFQLEAFSQNYQAVAWDAPGYGESTLVGTNLDEFVEALHSLIQSLGGERVILVGHSMGGTVASRYAARYPENVRALVLSCTHPGYGEPETAPMSAKFENRMKELKEIGKEAYGLQRAQDLLPFPDVPASVLAYAAEVAAETAPEGLRAATRALQLVDNRPLLPTIKAPTLILTGEKDKVVKPELKEALLCLTPHKAHIEMPGVAHAPYFQAPQYYNELIKNFISTY